MTSLARRQAGITVIGFLLLACLFGVVGLAAIKLVPMYIQNMKLSQVLEDVQHELAGQSTTPTAIRRAIENRFAIEDIDLPNDAVKINQSRNGYQVHITHENRVPYIADVWLLVVFDKQVEIAR
ncbi:MAG TPA: DUF4845 domain-containing protein [Gammaproteobacteria bacterium]